MPDLLAGIDFGSSVVKTAVSDGVETCHRSFGWREEGLDRRLNRSWWLALQRCLDSIQECATEFGGEVESLICSTVGPNFAFVGSDVTCGSNSGSVQQYDNWPAIACGDEPLRMRSQAMLADLRARSAVAGSPVVLSGAAWLSWLLTHEVVHDHVGFLEAGLDLAVQDALPRAARSVALGGAVAPILGEHSAARPALANTVIRLGASDSTALALKAESSGVRNLVYCGTFFTVLELVGSVRGWIRDATGDVPYRWHVSMPVGAYLERCALNSMSSAPVSRLIGEALDRAGRVAEDRVVQAPVRLEPWRVGESGFTLPKLVDTVGTSQSERDWALLTDFADRVAATAGRLGVSSFGLAGGLSGDATVKRSLSRVPVSWVDADFSGASISLELFGT